MSCNSCMYFIVSQGTDIEGKKFMECQRHQKIDRENGCKHYKAVVMVFDTRKQTERPSNRKERRDKDKNSWKVLR